MIYGLDAYAALEMCQKIHDYRGDVLAKGTHVYQSPGMNFLRISLE